jgi:hypothetical protein
MADRHGITHNSKRELRRKTLGSDGGSDGGGGEGRVWPEGEPTRVGRFS